MRRSMRSHAPFHSRLVMCVPASQNPMQSLSAFPPPPGALGDASLALPGDKARLLCFGTPPPEDGAVDCCGDSGAIPGICGAGVPIAEGGVAPVLGVDCGSV